MINREEKEKNNMKETALLSLQKEFFRLLFVIVGVIILLLGILDAYLISSYQLFLHSGWREALDRCAEDVRSDLSEINSDLYDIFFYDFNFSRLRTTTGIDSLQYVHELEDRLKAQILLKKHAAGYVIYYNGLENKRYCII